jgi:hypothetical protein
LIELARAGDNGHEDSSDEGDGEHDEGGSEASGELRRGAHHCCRFLSIVSDSTHAGPGVGQNAIAVAVAQIAASMISIVAHSTCEMVVDQYSTVLASHMLPCVDIYQWEAHRCVHVTSPICVCHRGEQA